VARRLVSVLVGAALFVSMAGAAFASNPNGSGGDMPAFYDGKLFTINFKLLKPDMHNNPSFNTIYQCDSCADQGLQFVSVLDAIQGDGFNPLWLEVQITFDTIAPQQFTSDEDILEAADAGEITLTPTTEVYRCSVIGPKD